MNMHVSKDKSIARAWPTAALVSPIHDTSCTVVDAHENDRVDISQVQSSPQGKGRAEQRELAKECGGSRTEVLSLAMLTLAVSLLLQMGVATWAIEVIDWPRSWYVMEEQVLDMYFDGRFVQHGFALLGLFIAAVFLIGKEFLVQRKDITLTVNVAAAASIMYCATMYVLYGFVILFDFAAHNM